MKNLLFLLMLVGVSLFVASCGGGKKTVSGPSNVGDVALADEPCQLYALEQPARRASGVGLHFSESTARNIAELQARAQLARALQACITTATRESKFETTLFSADDKAGASVTDQSGKSDDSAFGIAKEQIAGAVMVKVSRYKTPNNQYRIYVCVEYQEDVPQMAGKIAKAFSEKLTPEQKDKVKFDEYLFQQEMNKALSNYKGVTAQ